MVPTSSWQPDHVELTNQRATAYDAERDALKLVADL